MKVSDPRGATPALVDIARERSGAEGSGSSPAAAAMEASGSSSAANTVEHGEPIDSASAKERHGDNSASIVKAIKAVADKHGEMDRYLEDIKSVIGTVPDLSVRGRLTERLDTCREKSRMHRSILDAYLRADNPMAGSSKQIDARSVMVAASCSLVIDELQQLHAEASKHAGKTNVAKAIGLMVGGAILLAALATVSVLFAPVIVPGLALTGLLIAGAGAGTTGIAGLALLGLAIREFVAHPAAYRNLSQRNQALATELQSLGIRLQEWFAANRSCLEQQVAEAFDAERSSLLRGDDVTAFLQALRDSDLPDWIKSAVKGKGDAAEPGDGWEAIASRAANNLFDSHCDVSAGPVIAAGANMPVGDAEFAAARAAAVPPVNIGAAQGLYTKVVVTVWDEDLSAKRTGHTAIQLDTDYASYWPEEPGLNVLRGVPASTTDQSYFGDMVSMLNRTTRQALEARQFAPRPRQVEVKLKGNDTWGLQPDNNIHMPVFGDNRLTNGDVPHPRMFGLHLWAMQRLWRDVAEGQAGTMPTFKLLSKTRNCAGMVLQTLIAGGASIFVPPPKFRFFAKPSEVRKYATQVEDAMAQLNERVDAVLRYAPAVEGFRTDVSLPALLERNPSLTARLHGMEKARPSHGAPGAADISPYALMAFAKALLDEDRENMEQNPTKPYLALARRPEQLTLLYAIRQQMCAISAAKAEADAQQIREEYASVYEFDELDADSAQVVDGVAAEWEPEAPRADMEDPAPASAFGALEQASAIEVEDSQQVLSAWQSTQDWMARQIDEAEFLFKHLYPTSRYAIDLPQDDELAEDNLLARYMLLDRARAAMQALEAIADIQPEAFPRKEALANLVLTLQGEKAKGAKRGLAAPLHQAFKGDMTIPRAALPEAMRATVSDAWRTGIAQARDLIARLGQACGELASAYPNHATLHAALGAARVTAEVGALRRRLDQLRVPH